MIIGENIADLRKQNNYTQQELADMLAYSDKSISKWERGEATPDIEVLLSIAKLFDVDIKYLLEIHNEEEKQEIKKIEKRVFSYKVIISAISCVAIWFLVTILYSAFLSIKGENLWILFIWGFPATFLVLLIFASIWAKPKWIFITLSLMVWSFITAFYLTILLYTNARIWYIFFIGLPLQLAVILASMLVYKK